MDSNVGMGRRLGGRGTCVYKWLIHSAVQQKLTQHCKAIILQLKEIYSNYYVQNAQNKDIKKCGINRLQQNEK